ncbi:MarR family winged helix-turn-helix transcriptional regulator [Amnibacterium kyonggiense]|uniref:MarR family transcriptional regulator n=1 Tax=Amnibacterium kyonggiense TaxID=595671 RepID=A0A4R7FJ12_9MICO|nr:MarR family transcriptional regulator [Amnibacterium kyonggiense]TDS75802.1 MarR family transcriptional regulator [Amnibacterium kyonggiense]
MDASTATALRASRAMLGIVARSVAPALEQVSLPHFRVLVLLETSGPMRVGALAQRLGIVASTFSRSLDRLEAGGWVRRAASEESRRERIVTITAAGSELVRTVTSARAAELDRVLAEVATEDRVVLEHAFEAFADAAGEPALGDMLVLGI